ncbi:MAG: hypothetical protein JW829_16390 [Pirellulales bacterium]|nr:hypothetical protein [Pirellulales bacterium]
MSNQIACHAIATAFVAILFCQAERRSRGGRWISQQILPRTFVEAARQPAPSIVGLPEIDAKTYDNASDHYGLLWWNNADKTLKNVPHDAYWSWGLYDSLIVVIPSPDIVVARAGKAWQRKSDGHYDILKPFLDPIAASVHEKYQAPYPRSLIIQGIQWAPPSTIIRKAKGSDEGILLLVK